MFWLLFDKSALFILYWVCSCGWLGNTDCRLRGITRLSFCRPLRVGRGFRRVWRICSLFSTPSSDVLVMVGVTTFHQQVVPSAGQELLAVVVGNLSIWGQSLLGGLSKSLKEQAPASPSVLPCRSHHRPCPHKLWPSRRSWRSAPPRSQRLARVLWGRSRTRRSSSSWACPRRCRPTSPRAPTRWCCARWRPCWPSCPPALEYIIGYIKSIVRNRHIWILSENFFLGHPLYFII